MLPTYAVVREYIPDASDDYCEYVIWTKTGWPEFWNIPREGDTPEECFRTQLFWYAWNIKRGLDVCYGCGKSMRSKKSEMCPSCDRRIAEHCNQNPV